MSYDTWVMLEGGKILKLFDKITGKSYIIEFVKPVEISKVYAQVEEDECGDVR